MSSANVNATANVAVKDLPRARRFYEDVLGLDAVHEEAGELVTYRSGDSLLNVYRSEHAGSNKATAVTWEVEDIAAEIEALKRKGVAFEHYDMPGLRQEGDVHVAEAGGMQVAWFKDPDGNILNIVQ